MQPIALAGVPYPVSNFGRVAITCVAALLVGAIAYANAFDLHDTALGTVLYSSALTWALFLLPLLAVAVVNRWWALSIAFVPLAISVFLHSATDYVYPYHEDSYPALTVLGTAFLLVVYSLGFLLRAVFNGAVFKAWLPRLRERFGRP
jgi:hypothetical protein